MEKEEREWRGEREREREGREYHPHSVHQCIVSSPLGIFCLPCSSRTPRTPGFRALYKTLVSTGGGGGERAIGRVRERRMEKREGVRGRRGIPLPNISSSVLCPSLQYKMPNLYDLNTPLCSHLSNS